MIQSSRGASDGALEKGNPLSQRIQTSKSGFVAGCGSWKALIWNEIS